MWERDRVRGNKKDAIHPRPSERGMLACVGNTFLWYHYQTGSVIIPFLMVFAFVSI
jgi:hypothetical protein